MEIDNLNISIGANIFLLVDSSERVNSHYEAQRNAVLSELQPLLCNMAMEENIEVAVKTYFFKDLTEVYTMLNSRLSSLTDIVFARNYNPIIILISDGKQVESIADYRNALATLRSNKWYIAADKVAINLSDNFDNLVLSDFTGDREAVISSHQVDGLKYLFRGMNLMDCEISIPDPDWDDWGDWGDADSVSADDTFDQLLNDFIASQESKSSDLGKNSPTNFDEWL